MRYSTQLTRRGYDLFMKSRQLDIYNKEFITARATVILIKKRDKVVRIKTKVTQKVPDNGINLSNFHAEYLKKDVDYIVSALNKLKG